MKLTTLLAVPLLLMTQGFTLIITQKNGETTKIDTEDIQKFTFEEESEPVVTPPDDPTKPRLETPKLSYSGSGGTYTVTWNAVPNATFYRHNLDDGEVSFDKVTSATLSNLSAGTHTYTVIAVPSDKNSYSESLPGTVTIEVSSGVSIKAGETTSTTIQALMSATGTETYYVGIVPRTDLITDAELIDYVNTNSDSQRKELTGLNGRQQEVFFSNLTPNSHYILVAFIQGSTDKCSKYFTYTDIDRTPGSTGTVFPYGVSETSGFYDVDKVYSNLSGIDPSWTSDMNLCWACSCSGVLQWWMDDYKRKTGKDFELKKYPEAMPKESKAYSTPIMDMFVSAHNDLPGAEVGIPWFMYGVENNMWVNDENWFYKESYPYWKGGFMGMTKQEARKYLILNPEAHSVYDKEEDYCYTFNVLNSIKADASLKDVIKQWSNIFIENLQESPAYMSYTGLHALSLWGCDYKINEDGTPQITRMYICENSPCNGTNVKGGYNILRVSFNYDTKVKRYSGLIDHMTSGQCAITLTLNMRGWQPE